MSEFVTALNANGEEQRIPAEWLNAGHVFADQFHLKDGEHAPPLRWDDTPRPPQPHVLRDGQDDPLTETTTPNAPASGEEEN